MQTKGATADTRISNPTSRKLILVEVIFMKHLPIPTANATAATIAVVYIVCALGILLFPDISMTIAKSWFHGIDISKITLSTQTNPGSLILGFVTATGGGWLVGYIFASAYNGFAKK